MRSKNNKNSYYKGLLTGVVLCVLLVGVISLTGCFLGSYIPAALEKETGAENVEKADASDTDGENQGTLSDHYDEVIDKLEVLQALVDRYYLNDEDVDVDAMMDGIYKGYIDSLEEAYSVYYTAEEYALLQESTSGQYSGIGVVVTQNVETGVITVVRPFEGAPGAEAGILKDDIVYKVAGQEVTGEDLTEVVSHIKGEEGTFVEVEVYRPSEDKYYTFEVERRTIEVPMVEYEMLDNQIGYVALYEFEETSFDQFDQAIDDLTAQGMEGLILDLRDNPGGLIESAADILDRILPKDELLVYTVDKNGEKDELYSEDNETIDLPMAVLVNENSASASEIVSGCLQDYGRAQLVGTTTFGKGIVQYVLPLNDGSAVKLTSAKYYTPEGRNIHGIGIEPDVEAELDADSDTDTQLEKAVEAVLDEMGK